MEHWPKCAAECGQGIFQQIFYLAKGIVWDTGLGDCTGNVGILKCVGKTSKGLWEGGIEFLGHAKDYFCGVTDTEIVKDTVYCSEFSSDVFKYVGETGECIKNTPCCLAETGFQGLKGLWQAFFGKDGEGGCCRLGVAQIGDTVEYFGTCGPCQNAFAIFRATTKCIVDSTCCMNKEPNCCSGKKLGENGDYVDFTGDECNHPGCCTCQDTEAIKEAFSQLFQQLCCCNDNCMEMSKSCHQLRTDIVNNVPKASDIYSATIADLVTPS